LLVAAGHHYQAGGTAGQQWAHLASVACIVKYHQHLPISQQAAIQTALRLDAGRDQFGRYREGVQEAVLTTALLDADRETRQFAIRGLGRLGRKDSLAALSHCLSDEDNAVREAAIAAMTAIDLEHGSQYAASKVPLVAPLIELPQGLL
jgi:hypothetical protein